MSAELLAELELPVDQIRAARLVAGRIALGQGLDDEVAEDVKLAVGEAASRVAAAHGTGPVRLRFRRGSESLTAEFPNFPAPVSVVLPTMDGAAMEAADVDFGWLILTAVVPSLIMDGDTLRLEWPLSRVTS